MESRQYCVLAVEIFLEFYNLVISYRNSVAKFESFNNSVFHGVRSDYCS